MTSISIITVVKNGMPHIIECLQSVKKQTHFADEHIVVDAKSTDGTLEILNNNTEITLFSEDDRGISHAFNKACDYAKMEYICHLNSDDWIEPDHLKKVYKILTDINPDIVISNLFFDRINSKRILKPTYPSFRPNMTWFPPQINHPGMVIRKSFLQAAGGYNEDFKIAMDVELFYRLLQLSPKIYINNSPTVHQRDGGVSQRDWLKALQELKEIEIIYGRSYIAATSTFYFRISKSLIKKIFKFLVKR